MIMIKPSKYDKFKDQAKTPAGEGDAPADDDDDALPVGASVGDHAKEDEHANLKVAIILPKGYINMNDLEDTTIIAVRF
jgi:hypothetical protein